MLIPDPMPYKTTASPEAVPPAPLPALSGFEVLAADGPQAAAFLQAQAMNDVAALAVGQWQWNGWLTAKGRVVALFALLRTGEEAFRLVLPDHPAGELNDALSRFVFRSRVRLAVADDLACAAQCPAAGPMPARDIAQAGDDGSWMLDLGGDGGERRRWLLPVGSPRLGMSDPQVDAAWREADLRHGLPRLSPAQREAWTPQMLSLDRLRAYSLKKGCYPGQEIVARTHYLGQAKRALVLVAGQSLREGDVLADRAGAGLGTIASVDGAGRLGLAVANVETVDASAQVDGRPVERCALMGGLQRPA
jgi:folate-binding protein YgfZ